VHVPSGVEFHTLHARNGNIVQPIDRAAGPPRITVGIPSRNRPESLLRCIRSLAAAADVIDRVVVVDDASDRPLEPLLRSELGDDFSADLVVVRHDAQRGLAAGLNTAAAHAATEWILNLDDDALLLDRAALDSALAVADRDPGVGAVAFAQADCGGTPFPGFGQPSPAAYPCYVASFIGFAHLLRVPALRAAGGFREHIGSTGDEKDLCMRMLDAGFHTVYLPHARVGHLLDPGGRSQCAYLHRVVRNDLLISVYNEPFPLPLITVPIRLARYFPMRRHLRVRDPWGLYRLLARIRPDVARAWRERRPVRWRTLLRWLSLRHSPRYTAPAGGQGAA
jgi:GT2 family glycosyltransferase